MKHWRSDSWSLEWSWPGIEGLCKWDCHLRQCDNCREAFEAGADAMLKALKEKGTPLVNIPYNQVGYVVFVPV